MREMMDYHSMETSANKYETEVPSIKGEIQETVTILKEMRAVLNAFNSVINGELSEEVKEKEPSPAGLLEEARLMTALACDNLSKLRHIYETVV